MTSIIEFKKRSVTREIILHDSHTLPGVEKALDVLQWQALKMGLLDTGYHFVIDRDGHQTETRPMAFIGSALPGHDMTAVYICLIGGRDEAGVAVDNFTTEQRIALFDLVRTLKRFYGPIPFMGHTEASRGRDHKDHHRGEKFNCPSLDMVDLRADYFTYIKTGGSLV